MKPLFKLAFGAGLAAIPLMSSAIPGYVTDERGIVVRTDNPISGISECWHTSDWTQDMAIVGCDGKTSEVAAALPEETAPASGSESTFSPCEEHATISDDGQALFAFNKARLSATSSDTLNDLISRVKNLHSVDRVVITGHTDRLGGDAYNMRLSRRRAEAVRDYLVDRHAVDPGVVEIRAKGKTMPVKSCEGVKPRKRLISCLAPNRRVVVDVSGTSADCHK